MSAIPIKGLSVDGLVALANDIVALVRTRREERHDVFNTFVRSHITDTDDMATVICEIASATATKMKSERLGIGLMQFPDPRFTPVLSAYLQRLPDIETDTTGFTTGLLCWLDNYTLREQSSLLWVAVEVAYSVGVGQ